MTFFPFDLERTQSIWEQEAVMWPSATAWCRLQTQ